MISETVVELSRWQFAITAMLHFLFIPLTLGLALLLALMESAFVMTGQGMYKTMARFWGRILAINFCLAVASRLLVVFQFGMNGSYFSHYAGDVFALPLAIEALSSFFLAAVLFGPYWFGWDKLGKYQHLLVTWLLALAINVSAYWVFVGYGWMQNPVGAAFNFQSYRMELTDFAALLNNPVALTKYLHTVTSSYATAAATLMAISAYWLQKQQNDVLAQRSFKWAAGVGLLAIVLTAGLGDVTPNIDNPVQQAKNAAIHGEVDKNLIMDVQAHIRSGITAYTLLQDLRDDNKDPQLLAEFEQHKADLGYAMLLTPWHKAIIGAKEQQIALAAQSALPAYPQLLMWMYRFMLVCAGLGVLLFALAAFYSLTQKILPAWLLSLSIYWLPAPWLACVSGWFVAEAGKQPWAIAGILPTFLSVSSLSATELIISAIGYAMAYAVLLGVGLFLLRQTVINHGISGQGV